MRGMRTLRTSSAATTILAAGTPVVLAQHGTAAVPDEVDAPAVQAGGMPALHGLSGEEFGDMITELARSARGAVADHVRTFTPPAAPTRPAAAVAKGRADPDAHARRRLGAPITEDGLDFALSDLEHWPPGANSRRGGVGRS